MQIQSVEQENYASYPVSLLDQEEKRIGDSSRPYNALNLPGPSMKRLQGQVVGGLVYLSRWGLALVNDCLNLIDSL